MVQQDNRLLAPDTTIPTQNRDAKAIQLKLDELIRAVQGARTGLVRLEELPDQDLQSLAGDFEKLRARSGDQAAADESG
jgi:low affinity Fe/Cu permease